MLRSRVVPSVQELLTQLSTAYAEADSPRGSLLLTPATEEELESLAQQLGVPIPPQLRALWLFHDGQEYFGSGTEGLFGRHRLLSVSGALEQHRMLDENWLDGGEPPSYPPGKGDGGGWCRDLIPFASWDAFDLCVHAHDGHVWEFEPYDGLKCHWPSIAAVLEAALASADAEEPDLGGWRE